jgi:uncharacterized protein (DUF488 family)
MAISTIGYEGAAIQDFVALLKHMQVDILIDIRDLPLSRKKGFSKNALKQNLEEMEIGYLHLKALGDPKAGRDAARSGNFKKFIEIFTAHISGNEAKLSMKSIKDLAENKHVCLMCFERNHHQCHRRIVVEEISKLAKFEIRHLGVPKGFSKKDLQ